MKATLHITVDAILLEKAKTYAAEKKVSISQLVEDCLRRITEKPSKLSLLDIIDNLPKSTTDFPENFDFKKEYYEDRKEKHGFGASMLPAK
jgi:hypothetical protein